MAQPAHPGHPRRAECETEDAPLFHRIPHSILSVHILPHLAGEDKRAFRSTCQHARELVNGSVKAVRVTAHDFFFDLSQGAERRRLGLRFPSVRAINAFDSGDYPWTDELLIDFLSESDRLLAGVTSVDLKQCHYVAGPLLKFLRKACPNLSHLRTSRWTDNCLLWLLPGFRSLEQLDLGDADVDVIAIDDTGLGALGGCERLRGLSLRRCRYLTDDACVALARLGQLRTLDLSCTEVTGHGLTWLASLRHLHSLSLSDCKIDDEGLERCCGLTGLLKLELRNTRVTNAGLRPLKGLRWLQTLDLGARFAVDDEGMDALVRCPSLTDLLAGSFSLTSPASGLKELRHLQFGGMYASKGLEKLFPLPGLKSLNVQGIDAVTDAVMARVSSQTSLQALALSGGYTLTTDGLSRLAPLTGLVSLSLSACPHITHSALQAFSVAHGRLAKLLVDCCPGAAAPEQVCPHTSANCLLC